jgi:GDP-L-fucose synthase
MEALGWEADTSLREGIEKTYDWYRAHEDEFVASSVE